MVKSYNWTVQSLQRNERENERILFSRMSFRNYMSSQTCKGKNIRIEGTPSTPSDSFTPFLSVILLLPFQLTKGILLSVLSAFSKRSSKKEKERERDEGNRHLFHFFLKRLLFR